VGKVGISGVNGWTVAMAPVALVDAHCVWTTAVRPDAACAAATGIAVFAWAGNAVWMDDCGVCVGGYAVCMDDRGAAGRGLRRCYRGPRCLCRWAAQVL